MYISKLKKLSKIECPSAPCVLLKPHVVESLYT